MNLPPPRLEVKGLKKHFEIHRTRGLRMVHEVVRAVDGIDITVMPGETVGLVGESGCGKTTAGRAILRLLNPTAGSVELDGIDLLTLSSEELRKVRRRLNIVFQDPYAAVDPRMRIGEIVAEPLRAHGMAASRTERLTRAADLLQSVGLSPDHVNRYPHEFSGGQRQRIGIARAIATDPALLILDEPISALDISVRAQILNLLADLREERGLSYLFIAHDLAVVHQFCDRVAVMYLGIIVEHGSSEQVFRSPKHPYTQALIASIPSPDPAKRTAYNAVEGDVPSPVNIPSGCRFRTRCPLAQEICAREVPPLRDLGAGRLAACHFAEPDF